MRNMEALEAVQNGGQVECTLAEYVPPAGIGIRGMLALYAMQREGTGDFAHALAARQEIVRLDQVLGWKPEANG